MCVKQVKIINPSEAFEDMFGEYQLGILLYAKRNGLQRSSAILNGSFTIQRVRLPGAQVSSSDPLAGVIPTC